MSAMGLTASERAVVQAVARRRDELVELLRALIGFDTVTPRSARRRARRPRCSASLGARLASCGAEVRVAEPEPVVVAGHPTVPEGFSFAGRPQLVARFAGTGGGRTLLLNGHVDVVSVEPRARWSRDPFAAVVGDGAVYGRGACDMKGGVACMVVAAEVLAAAGVRLRRRPVVNTVTDEESTGAGGLASARTLHADGGDRPGAERARRVDRLPRLACCRAITVEGRAGHAGLPPRHPDAGGAVNAIEKTALLVDAIRRLREDWALRPRHPLPVGRPTASRPWSPAASGSSPTPRACRLDCHIEFLPDQADERRLGLARRGASSSAGSRGRRGRPVAARAPAARSSGWSGDGAAGRGRRPTTRSCGALLGAERDLGRAGRARRPRQLARRRDADRRGRHPRRLLRPRRHPPRPHRRRARPDRRSRRLRPGHRRDRDALLRDREADQPTLVRPAATAKPSTVTRPATSPARWAASGIIESMSMTSSAPAANPLIAPWSLPEAVSAIA